MQRIKQFIPAPLKRLASHVRRMLRYSNYDSSAYWRNRAALPDQAAVLWQNQDYNRLYRADEQAVIARWLEDLPVGARILDIGCGIGVVASMVRELRPDVAIDGVDFPEMVELARSRTDGQRINYIAACAEEFGDGAETYDVIISSGCYSAIRNIANLKRAITNGAAMLKRGGLLLMIDPFHRWNYLARAKFGSSDVIAHLQPLNLRLIERSGMLFWPYRMRLANSTLTGEALRSAYRRGERWLRLLGQHLWADYKVLVFRKSP